MSIFSLLETHIFDIILILVSGSACLYCWLLSRRLKALQDTRKGIGASIVGLSTALSKTTIAAQEARHSTTQSVEHLQKLLEDVDASIPKIEMMLENLEISSQRTCAEIETGQKQAAATISPLLSEAKERATTLSVIVAEIDAYSRRIRSLQAAANEVTARNTAGSAEVHILNEHKQAAR
ncbi:hypothetical protein [Parvularcula sp. IMCC14364]|uniref:hypothetical protein n=1 Tax=Parvularcula sp. IMCC14364 TaxID=3067902 RepID=UPI0027406595|nr:hypothetical protein [Parvularcula sp. IMCC14364]